MYPSPLGLGRRIVKLSPEIWVVHGERPTQCLGDKIICWVTYPNPSSSLQCTLKRVGPKTDPCGTPYLTRLQQERELFTFPEVVRSTRYDRNYSKALSLTPMSARR